MDIDRIVKRGRERLAQEVEVTSPLPIPTEMETLGEAGKVDEAEALMRKVDMLNAKKTALTQQSTNDKEITYRPQAGPDGIPIKDPNGGGVVGVRNDSGLLLIMNDGDGVVEVTSLAVGDLIRFWKNFA
ncbi:hypothetical protein QJS10_CPA08g00475 [Acorus calamus]|uniref:Uncharacterized protein n=1 Tax=Acorus calamus TaxID=4465 RepID=A0AAV9EAU4_ACOCL|nr:hypothetical protein QJS10_CPA08g00475 [Acorus calamus]